MSQKCKFCFLLYQKEIYAQLVETNVLVKHNIYYELKLTIMDLDLQITRKRPVCAFIEVKCIFSGEACKRTGQQSLLEVLFQCCVLFLGFSSHSFYNIPNLTCLNPLENALLIIENLR